MADTTVLSNMLCAAFGEYNVLLSTNRDQEFLYTTPEFMYVQLVHMRYSSEFTN